MKNTDRLKFRAWDKKTKKMIATGFYVIGECTMFDLVEQYCYKNPCGAESVMLRFNDIVLMQSTGTKIKDTLLYEGDIIQIGEYRRIVAYSANLGRFVTYFKEDFSRLHSIYKGDFEDFIEYENKGFVNRYLNNEEFKDQLEIIGNMYENEEFLINK